MTAHKRLAAFVAGGLLVGAAGTACTPVSPDSAGSSTARQTNGAVAQGSAAQANTETAADAQTIEFFGEHQAGVETPQATHQTFLGFNLERANRQDAEAILRLVTDDAARLTAGKPALGDMEPGIAANPARLTITVGLGKAFFDAAQVPAPEQLRDIPSFSTDRLEKKWDQTDFVVQIGSDDPLTLTHAARMITKDIRGLAVLAWAQDGYTSTAPALPDSDSTRNHMGQVDGTVNPEPGSSEFAEVVWIDSDVPYAENGTVLVLRRIEMHMNEWDALDLTAQERAIGRERDSGAPLGGKAENEPLPLAATDEDGLPTIPEDAHARVAHAASTDQMIYRRPYNYHGTAPGTGTIEVGLLFAAYMRDPATSFIPMQRRIAESDAFNEWNTTIGSATYFLLPGTEKGSFLGEEMFQ